MKVGTDSVLLGAWCPIDENPITILDIGAGTGILSLMLAQRTTAEQIDAIEIDADAFEECVNNFENSPWNDRLFCFHCSLDDFMDSLEDEEYDLIISNPPFYTDNYKPSSSNREKARFEDSLPFEDLLEASSVLLSENGQLAVIIPHKEEEHFIQLALENDLYCEKITRVKGTPNTEIKRSLLLFSRVQKPTTIDEIYLENQRHQYSDEYINLTKDFYLKM